MRAAAMMRVRTIVLYATCPWAQRNDRQVHRWSLPTAAVDGVGDRARRDGASCDRCEGQPGTPVPCTAGRLTFRFGAVRRVRRVVVVVIPRRRRTMCFAMSSAAESWRRTKLAFAARMMPPSSNVSSSGSSSPGSSCCSRAATANWRIWSVNAVLERGDLLLDRSRARAHLEDGAGKEAAARERSPGEVFEERITHRDKLPEPCRGTKSGSDDLGLEDPTCFIDGRQLEILLRAEVRVDAALAHVERVSEISDR